MPKYSILEVLLKTKNDDSYNITRLFDSVQELLVVLSWGTLVCYTVGHTHTHTEDNNISASCSFGNKMLKHTELWPALFERKESWVHLEKQAPVCCLKFLSMKYGSSCCELKHLLKICANAKPMDKARKPG